MTQLPPYLSLIQYYQLRDGLVMLLYELADLAEHRDLTIVVDEWIDGRIPKSHLATNADAFNQFSLRAIVEEDIQPVYEPFRIAVVGEFTRGKTTLLNALLEREVLTSDRRPNTATCTTLKYGEIERIQVTYFDSTGLNPIDIETQNLATDLARYTSDAAMDQEKYEALLRRDEQSLAEQVERVTVSLPAEFLRQRGFEVVDTPGLGSIFDMHQVITYNAIPRMDAVLFLTQFNALIGEGEMIFLGSLREYLDRFLFVLTKVDLAEKEQNPQEAVDKAINFTRSVLTSQAQLHNAPVYSISAIAAVRDGQYKESGIIQLTEALDQFIAHSRGRERLLNLYKSANTYHIWVEQDIQRELDDLNRQIAQLDEAIDRLVSDINYVELSGHDLNLLLQSQTEQLAQSWLAHISQLPERLQRQCADALEMLNLEALKEAPVNLRSTVHDIVQAWFKEQETIFMQGVRLLQDDARFFLSKMVHRAVQINWGKPDSTLIIKPPELPLLDRRMEKIQLGVMFASVTGITRFVREHIKRELIEPQLPSNQTAYERIVFDTANALSIHNQAEYLFTQWAKSLYQYLETTINREITGYRERIEEQIHLINQQQNLIRQRLKSIDQQHNQIQNIHSSLENIKLTIRANSKT